MASPASNPVSQVHASNGKLLNTWTGATSAVGVLVAMGRVFVTGDTVDGGRLYMIDPTGQAGPVTEITNNGLGDSPVGIAFDGSRIWTANNGGSFSIITPGVSTPWSVTTVSAGVPSLPTVNPPRFSQPQGILFDGSNMWVTDVGDNTLKKLDQSGAIVQMVNVGNGPQFPAFDGTNNWVPNSGDNTVSVVRAATGSVIATLTGNGLVNPTKVAFDGQRILVANKFGVSLWKAADLTPIGTFSTPAGNAWEWPPLRSMQRRHLLLDYAVSHEPTRTILTQVAQPAAGNDEQGRRGGLVWPPRVAG